MEILTNGLGQGNDYILAGRLFRKAAYNPHHSVHPNFELHLGPGRMR